LDEALLAYQYSVKIKPTSANTLLNMAIILHTKGRYEAAINACKRAISTDPTYFAAYANMGILHQRNGDTSKAIKTYIEAIELKPDFAPAYFNLGTAFESAGEISKAIEMYVEALKLNGDPQSANPKFHGRLATALVEAGHLQRNVSLSFDPSRHCRPIGTVCKHEKTCLGTSSRDLDPSFFLNVGMVYLDSYLYLNSTEKLLDWAEAMLRLAAIRGGNNFHAAHFLLGNVFELKKNFEAAVEFYQQALKSRQDSGLYAHALNRLQRSNGPALIETKTRGADYGIYARVGDAVNEIVDRYGCSSRFLTPLRVLNRIARSQERMLSYIAVTINAAPPLLSPPPDRFVISDVISDVYLRGGWKGLFISNSGRNLKAYRKHFERRNFSNVSFVRTRNTNIEYTLATLHEQLASTQNSPGLLGGNQSIDFLRLDNFSCSCDMLISILNGTNIYSPLVPKLVMFQVSAHLLWKIRALAKMIHSLDRLIQRFHHL
jgi:tetratricopeptide (TPR) repeat protein